MCLFKENSIISKVITRVPWRTGSKKLAENWGEAFIWMEPREADNHGRAQPRGLSLPCSSDLGYLHSDLCSNVLCQWAPGGPTAKGKAIGSPYLPPVPSAFTGPTSSHWCDWRLMSYYLSAYILTIALRLVIPGRQGVVCSQMTQAHRYFPRSITFRSMASRI